MFTNWLTDNTAPKTFNIKQTTTFSHQNNQIETAVPAETPFGSKRTTAVTPAALSTNMQTASSIMSTPPDVVLEVGPAPTTMRFMAHSIVLGMHSGYLRSAIRLDERHHHSHSHSNNNNGANAHNMAATSNIVLYLNNVTPEQFAPLLTYMYTGYLDLNVENIFGVLLATHVLHMPRALEICRSYLARAQTEGYLGSRANNNNNNSHQPAGCPSVSANKIIRPIPSKPQLTNFGFLNLTAHSAIGLGTMPTSGAITAVPVMSIQTTELNRAESVVESDCKMSTQEAANEEQICCNPNDEDDDDDIEIEESDKHSENNDSLSVLNHRQNSIAMVDNANADDANDDDDDEDVEVFIDSNSDAEVIIETVVMERKHCSNQNSSKKNTNKNLDLHQSKNKNEKPTQSRRSHKTQDKRRRKSSSGLQIAKAPIPASQLDNSEANRVIIDVASCDGPVRFKRILNTAYLHNKSLEESYSAAAAANTTKNHGHHHVQQRAHAAAMHQPQERSLQSVSLSFHQQMAKTISQQHNISMQHQQHNHLSIAAVAAAAEESENSETSNGSGGGGGGGGGGTAAGVCAAAGKSNALQRKTQNEIFVCVYCKHTFKSQYCYQKHAKRHLNPLTLQATCVPPSMATKGAVEVRELSKSNVSAESQEQQALMASSNNCELATNQIQTTKPDFFMRNSQRYSSSNSTQPLVGGQIQSAASTNNAHASSHHHHHSQHQQLPHTSTSSSAADYLRREVRPLDMNVQYYPCKTCGCKFPSYYFVHKHRKLCHAEEEAAAAAVAAVVTTASETSAINIITTNQQSTNLIENHTTNSDLHSNDVTEHNDDNDEQSSSASNLNKD